MRRHMDLDNSDSEAFYWIEYQGGDNGNFFMIQEDKHLLH